MKKMSVIISLLVGVLVLFFAVEPCLSQAVKDEFVGYRYRLSPATQLIVTDFACRRNIEGQNAEWQVVVGNDLVDGYWLNVDAKCRYPIVSFTKGGVITPCDPSVGPPDKPYTVTVGGPYIVFGPFTLIPDKAEGGYWEGTWKIQTDKDLNRVMTAEAKGHGGLLEGRSLHLSTIIPAPMPTWCACPGCPTSPFPHPYDPTKKVTSDMCFDGWVLTPDSAQ
ncbi:MAG: hypothetical protein JXL20_06335 [Deltaproteobacteria bacterium]|nr:hypothetical protein [Deltaproteobacteria bacterium]